jgi:hypothetical protein
VAPESFVCRRQSLLPSRATGGVQPPVASKSPVHSVARPVTGRGDNPANHPAGIVYYREAFQRHTIMQGIESSDRMPLLNRFFLRHASPPLL